MTIRPTKMISSVFAGILSLTIATQAWAIAGVDFPLEDDLDFTEVQSMIDEGEYQKAISYLDFEVLEWYPENAEALNLKAYSLRSMGRLDDAMEHYNAALASDPTHKGALEYQGELFLKLGDQDAAEANLQKLANLCPRGCEAHDILQAAIERFKDGEVSWTPPARTRTLGE